MTTLGACVGACFHVLGDELQSRVCTVSYTEPTVAVHCWVFRLGWTQSKE